MKREDKTIAILAECPICPICHRKRVYDEENYICRFCDAKFLILLSQNPNENILESFNLSTIPDSLVNRVRERLKKDPIDIVDVLCLMENTKNLDLVIDNIAPLLKIEKYEEALFHAYTITRTNHLHISFRLTEYLFNLVEPEKMRSLGDPIPNQKHFTLYRGVAGRIKKRRVGGFSWTSSLKQAAWFANRYVKYGLEDPAVFTITVPNKCILAYTNDRQENEYIVDLPRDIKPKRLNKNKWIDLVEN